MAYPNNQGNGAGAIPVWMAPMPPAGLVQVDNGYQLLDLSDNNAHGLTIPTGATVALVQPEAGNARWRIDAAPTADNGAILWGTSERWFGSSSFADLKFIQMTGSTGTKLSVSYFG